MKKNTALYILLSIAASALNYFAYPLLARLLPETQYVDITVSLSLMTQVSAFMSALTAVTVGITKKGGPEKDITNKLQASLLQIFTLIGLCFLALSPLILPSINTPTRYALPIVVMIIVSIPITVVSGYLNGKGSMVKLGGVAVLTASMQFLTGGIVAAITHNGFLTMTSMGLIQIVSLVFLVKFLNEPDMPKLGKELLTLGTYSKATRKLLVFTTVSAFAIMIINILQVYDLLLIKNFGGQDARFYTDIYVISRIVFFAGMIFIWPFLASISAHEAQANRRAFLKLIGVFGALALGAIVILFFFGNVVTELLFGKTYEIYALRVVLSLSILYKTFFLIITASCLFIIAQHSYKHIWLTFATAAIVITVGLAATKSILAVLGGLVLASGVLALISFLVVWLHKPSPQN